MCARTLSQESPQNPATDTVQRSAALSLVVRDAAGHKAPIHGAIIGYSTLPLREPKNESRPPLTASSMQALGLRPPKVCLVIAAASTPPRWERAPRARQTRVLRWVVRAWRLAGVPRGDGAGARAAQLHRGHLTERTDQAARFTLGSPRAVPHRPYN